MFSDSGRAVLIDFDSCGREGEKLGEKGGTFQWCREEVEVSERESDLYGVRKVAAFLDEVEVDERSVVCRSSRVHWQVLVRGQT